MDNLEALTPERMTEFLSGTAGIDFTGQSRVEKYMWMQAMLAEQQYFSLGKKERGVVRALLAKVAGLSLPQITRLIRGYRQDVSGQFVLEAWLPGIDVSQTVRSLSGNAVWDHHEVFRLDSPRDFEDLGWDPRLGDVDHSLRGR